MLSESTATDRWPQLARGYSTADFTSLRATVACEWEDIDHEDLHVDPEELLDMAGGA